MMSQQGKQNTETSVFRIVVRSEGRSGKVSVMLGCVIEVPRHITTAVMSDQLIKQMEGEPTASCHE